MSEKIDKIDRQLLYELDKHCRMSDNQLARIVGRSRESVRQRITKLQERGIIQQFITSINPSKLGYTMFKLYFQLAGDPHEHETFFSYLRGLRGMYWFGSNDGVWDLHCTVYAKDYASFNVMKNALYTRWKHIIVKRDVGVLVCTRQYPKKYLYVTKERLSPVFFAGPLEHHELHELDMRLLSILSQEARISLVELAQRLDSTVDIVRGRMKKLEEGGIIMQYRIAVDHTQLGYTMFKAFLYFDNLSQKDITRLLEYGKQHPNVLYVIEQISAWDYELEVMAESYTQFTQLMNELRSYFKDSLKHYEFALMREDNWALDPMVLG